MQPLELAPESLESRLLLAGNVRAVVTGAGNLIIRGDAQDNQIEIVAGATSDQLVVVGINTTINGSSADFVADGVTRKVRILLRGGDDQLDINSTPNGGVIQLDQMLFANMGAGNDTVNIDGGGPLSSDRFDTIYIRGQAGNDVVSIQNVTMGGDLRVFDTTGHDVVLVANINMDGENCEIDVATCPGDDEICFEGDFTGMDIRIRGGKGVDTLLGGENLPANADISGVDLYGPHDA